MTVAVIALVMSMTGGAIAAVNFAQNAGKVDGKDAVKAGAGEKKRAGNLVATYKSGKKRGKLPLRVVAGAASENSVERLSDLVARGRNGAELIAVADNAVTAAQTLINLELGNLQVSCADQQNQAGTENATTRIGITNHSGGAVNIARRLGGGEPVITTLADGIVENFSVGQQNTFSVQLQGAGNKTVLVEGTARQIGQGTADSACAVWATAIFVE
jgi:hypothetical protein